MKLIKNLFLPFFLICTIFASRTGLYAQDRNDIPLYLRPDITVEKKVEDLLSRMTLEEKVGQFNIPRPIMVKLEHPTENEGCVHFIKGKLLSDIGPGRFKVMVGSSSAYIRLRRSFNVKN